MLVQEVPEGCHGAGLQGIDGGGLLAHDPGDLRGAKADEEAEDEDVALVVREGLEGGAEVEVVDDGGGIAGGMGAVGAGREVEGALGGVAPLAQGLALVVADEVVGDAVQPGEDGAATVGVGADGADGGDEDGGGDVGSGVVVENACADVAVDGGEVGLVDGRPGIFGAVFRFGDEGLLVIEAAFGRGGVFPLVLSYDRTLPPSRDWLPPFAFVYRNAGRQFVAVEGNLWGISREGRPAFPLDPSPGRHHAYRDVCSQRPHNQGGAGVRAFGY